MAVYINTPPSTPSPIRTHTGFSLLNRIRSKDSPKHSRVSSYSSNASLRPHSLRTISYESSDRAPSRDSLFSIPAQEAAGTRSRRLSISAHDDLVVDTCDLDEEFVSASKFGWRKECGKGSSATVKVMVKRGDKKGEGAKYAVKEFRKRSGRESEEEYVRKVKSEFTIAKSLRHPNIVETVRLCTQGGRWNHVMEFCSQGELFSLVDRKYMKADDKVCIFKQVLRGVGYLHEQGIAHRDIKLENLLMTEDGYIKITDFGVSEVFRGSHPGLSPAQKALMSSSSTGIRLSAPGVCGSRPYISPEVLAQDKPYDASKLDVWSCGILYITMLLNGNPWQSPNTRESNYEEFMSGWESFLSQDPEGVINDQNYPQCGRAFNVLLTNSQRRCIYKMLHPNPAQRCTIKEALSDRWMKSVNCCSPESYDMVCSGIDVAKLNTPAAVAKLKVQVKHDHMPPPTKRLPQHRFDMGDGTSRYD